MILVGESDAVVVTERRYEIQLSPDDLCELVIKSLQAGPRKSGGTERLVRSRADYGSLKPEDIEVWVMGDTTARLSGGNRDPLLSLVWRRRVGRDDG